MRLLVHLINNYRYNNPVTVSPLGFVLPLPAVIAALANDEFKYIVVTFPPSVCVTQSQDLFFYSIFLALDVLLAAITCLIITVFWSLRKVNKHIKVFSINLTHFLILSENMTVKMPKFRHKNQCA